MSEEEKKEILTDGSGREIDERGKLRAQPARQDALVGGRPATLGTGMKTSYGFEVSNELPAEVEEALKSEEKS